MSKRCKPAERKVTADRFIPKRSCIEGAQWQLSYTFEEEVFSSKPMDSEEMISSKPQTAMNGEEFVNTVIKLQKSLNYKKKIWDALFPGDKPYSAHNNVLDFSLPKKGSKNNNKQKKGLGDVVVGSWPAHPRRKPLLSKPATVLDLPDVDIIAHDHVIDWGRQGQIATIIQGEVHLWSSKESAVCHTSTNGTLESCVKWNAKGTLFAVGRKGDGMVSVVEAKTLKIIRTMTCECFRCRIKAIAWRYDDVLVMGCSAGRVAVLSHIKNPLYFILTTEPVVDIQFSCYGTYMAILDSEENLWIFSFDLAQKMEIVSQHTNCLLFSFHPWQESLLAIGYTKFIAIHNVPDRNPRVPQYLMNIPEHCFLDCLTFNPKSAELLCSFYYEDVQKDLRTTFLTVISSANTVTDEIQVSSGRILLAIWDSTGTKLATASADENLAIWNFFGANTTLEKKYLNEYKKPSVMNMFEVSKKFSSIR